MSNFCTGVSVISMQAVFMEKQVTKQTEDITIRSSLVSCLFQWRSSAYCDQHLSPVMRPLKSHDGSPRRADFQGAEISKFSCLQMQMCKKDVFSFIEEVFNVSTQSAFIHKVSVVEMHFHGLRCVKKLTKQLELSKRLYLV